MHNHDNKESTLYVVGETTVTAKSPKAGSTNSSTAELNQGGVKMMAAEPIMVSQSPGKAVSNKGSQFKP